MKQLTTTYKTALNNIPIHEYVYDSFLCESIRTTINTINIDTKKNSPTGSTLSTVILRHMNDGSIIIYCTNIGDSRCIMNYGKGFKTNTISLSRDHNFINDQEMDRIRHHRPVIWTPLPLTIENKPYTLRQSINKNITHLTQVLHIDEAVSTTNFDACQYISPGLESIDAAEDLITYITSSTTTTSSTSSSQQTESPTNAIDATVLSAKAAALILPTRQSTPRSVNSGRKATSNLIPTANTSNNGSNTYDLPPAVDPTVGSSVQLPPAPPAEVTQSSKDLTSTAHSVLTSASSISPTPSTKGNPFPPPLPASTSTPTPLTARGDAPSEGMLSARDLRHRRPSLRTSISLLVVYDDEETPAQRDFFTDTVHGESKPVDPAEFDSAHHAQWSAEDELRMTLRGEIGNRLESSQAELYEQCLLNQDNQYITMPLLHQISFVARRKNAKDEESGPTALFSRHGVSIMMTRSIGDRNAARSCMCTPEVTKYTLPAGQHARIVIASDGLLDVMSNVKIYALIQGIADPIVASEKLVRYASELRRSRGIRIDDITCIVLDINSHLNPRLRGGQGLDLTDRCLPGAAGALTGGNCMVS